MKRHQENTSIFDATKKAMKWRVEWIFPSCDEVMVSTHMNEGTAPRAVLAQWLEKQPGNAPTRCRLQHYVDAGIDSLSLMLHAENVPGLNKQYHPIKANLPLKDLLAGKTIVEYPVIVVALPKEASQYPEVVESKQEHAEEYAEEENQRGAHGEGNVSMQVVQDVGPDVDEAKAENDKDDLEEGEIKSEIEGSAASATGSNAKIMRQPKRQKKNRGSSFANGAFTIGPDGSIIRTSS